MISAFTVGLRSAVEIQAFLKAAAQVPQIAQSQHFTLQACGFLRMTDNCGLRIARPDCSYNCLSVDGATPSQVAASQTLVVQAAATLPCSTAWDHEQDLGCADKLVR